MKIYSTEDFVRDDINVASPLLQRKQYQETTGLLVDVNVVDVPDGVSLFDYSVSFNTRATE